MKKILILLSLVFSVAATSVNAAVYSDWAEENVIKAELAGILTSEQLKGDFTKPITRSDIAMLTVKAYMNVTGYEVSEVESHFTDTKSVYAETAYRLGILYGTSDTEFTPNSYTTRQEMAKIILSLEAVINNEELILPSLPTPAFIDFDLISDWAKPYVAKAAADEIIMGFPDGSFGGDMHISWEQAISLILRCADLNELDELPTIEEEPTATAPPITETPQKEINLSGSVGTLAHGATRITWNAPTGTTAVTVTQARNSYYETDTAPITNTYQASGYLDIVLNPNRTYTISVEGGTSRTFKTEKVTPVGGDAIKAAYPTTKGEADPLMVSVTVPVWRLVNGEKVSSEATFLIHNAIADKIKLVFEEIYNGEEKFPIKDLGGYAWRGGRSEHNGGTAVDINANENFCIYNNGTTIGSYWKPYDDPYSIKPHGDVVNAFERHGFTWGGDSWRNPKDYMHFSYLGT